MNIMHLLPRKNAMLEKEIDRAIEEMATFTVESDEYTKASVNLRTLFEAKSLEGKWTISPDTVVAVMANLVGILLILNYEKMGIITTKAVSFLPKGRI